VFIKFGLFISKYPVEQPALKGKASEKLLILEIKGSQLKQRKESGAELGFGGVSVVIPFPLHADHHRLRLAIKHLSPPPLQSHKRT